MVEIKFRQRIIAGETFQATARPCSAAVSARLNVGGPSVAHVDGVPVSGGFSFSLDSTAWLPGKHAFEVWLTDAAGAKTLFCRERFDVEASLVGSQAGTDTRSEAERNVDALKLRLSQISDPNADQSAARYKINNRELYNYTPAELRELLVFWRRELARERRRARGLSGDGPNLQAYI